MNINLSYNIIYNQVYALNSIQNIVHHDLHCLISAFSILFASSLTLLSTYPSYLLVFSYELGSSSFPALVASSTLIFYSPLVFSGCSIAFVLSLCFSRSMESSEGTSTSVGLFVNASSLYHSKFMPFVS